jgi:hypothetical protein
LQKHFAKSFQENLLQKIDEISKNQYTLCQSFGFRPNPRVAKIPIQGQLPEQALRSND